MEEFMKAHELAGYFAKKVGKPIAFTIDEIAVGGSFSSELTYAVEPIAVSDENVLHALVTLKSRTVRMGIVKLPKESVVNQEVDIPLKDGDNMTLVLMMAVAEADEGADLLKLPEDNIMRRVYESLQRRLTDRELVRIGIGP
jgi:hypothetical protein